MRMGMVIDLSRCVGCNTCAVTCKAANNLPKNNWWNRVATIGGESIDTAGGAQWPDSSISFLPISCQHCANPACTRVCPVGATYKREDGVVFQDYDRCIGCRMCMAACPYTGVRSFNWEEPANYHGFATGDADSPAHQKHVVEKCTMCAHRLARGEEPACMALCLARARHWGDLDDPGSEVSKLIVSRSHEQLLPEMGTNPSVYYLI